ncbi:hypothetical protein BT96DRAFT_248652 [Gymnopus androsaceus JB14]|uniref:BZIP domain-containing protein n=1 Tax=Gymnopus androsaceus JB14 TaxID=1447944 RepID=A0A6A4IKS5_9AGAR|nr:hypothetical protein BT96DRAFT_248652 [Gymnopus androsaceus JB14]
MSSSTTNPPKSTEQNSRQSDITARKAKNALAQAQFRARNNYITTLEETVLNLESVVTVLQSSCREARVESQDLQQENIRLRQALRDRENFWRALWPKKGQGSEAEEFPQYPSPQPSTFSSSPQYDQSSIGMNNPYPPSPSVSFANQPYSSWTQTSSHSSNSPRFAESPTLTSSSDMPYAMNRYPAEDQKMALNCMEPVAPYMFPTSRSISPSSSTPPSSSTTSLPSSFPFGFSDAGAVQDRPEFDYRRQSAHGPEVTLHGGTADVSMASGSGDGGVRYRLGNTRRLDPAIPLLPPIAAPGTASENGSDCGDSSYPQRHRPRRSVDSPSRSPSPGVPLSGTLAIIKAASFGALRRTRVRSKKPVEGPARVARDVLESRGIVAADSAVQVGTKRRRLSDDDDLSGPPS